MKNGTLKLAIPPGYVDARCLVCRVDVVIPEGTLRCPNGEHDVEPTSLARMPRMEPPSRVVPLPAELAPAIDTLPHAHRPVAAVEVPAASDSVQPKTVGPIALPPMDSALAWYGDTIRLRDELVDEEFVLTEKLRRVRGMRKRLDQVVGLFVDPETPTVEQAAIPAPAVVVTPVVAEAAPAQVTPASGEKLWARRAGYAACRNCGTTKVPHGSHGRCVRCDSYRRARGGAERPRELWETTEPQEVLHGGS